MLTAWRLVKEKHASSAFSGEGAARFGGRWNSRGIRAVYTSSSRSLAALEVLVHLNPPVSFRFKLLPAKFPQSLVERMTVEDLPDDWRSEPPPPSIQTIGDEWVRSQRSSILAIPSTLVQEELNYLINPLHPDFQRITLGVSEDFNFDPRLLD
jgi:RES domain-containing protein